MSLNVRLLLWAVVAQALLTLVLCVWMALRRGADFKAGLDPQAAALRDTKWSVKTQQVSNAFANQFELPVLFYVVCILFMLATRVNLVTVILAWLFVLFRIAHAVVHTGSNIVMRRGAIFGFGLIVLVGMWLWFAFSLAMATIFLMP